MNGTSRARYFEDFAVGQVLEHATPRTLTEGDTAIYMALYGPRSAVQSSSAFARQIGYQAAPLDDLLVFHVVFGRTVPDISANAVANLGYAECRFLRPVFAGDTLCAVSDVIGLRQNSNGRSGIVYVRSRGINQNGEDVLEYVRWVMVEKADEQSPAPDPVVPNLADTVAAEDLGGAVPPLKLFGWDMKLAGSSRMWGDYEPGERIDHVDGVTIEAAEHMMATRLYQNTARVHFDRYRQAQGRHGRRIVYGGHVMSVARALSFNGLENAFHIAAINSGRHVAPCFAGDTVFAWSEVVDKAEIGNRSDIGALRIMTYATRDRPCDTFPGRAGDTYEEGVVLELDYWVAMPR